MGGGFVFACEEACECVCEGDVVVDIVWVRLVDSCADHGCFGLVELFVAFSHEAGGGFEDEFCLDEFLDVWVEGGAGAGGELCDVCDGAFA